MASSFASTAAALASQLPAHVVGILGSTSFYGSDSEQISQQIATKLAEIQGAHHNIA
jgi:hypothetical protein